MISIDYKIKKATPEKLISRVAFSVGFRTHLVSPTKTRLR